MLKLLMVVMLLMPLAVLGLTDEPCPVSQPAMSVETAVDTPLFSDTPAPQATLKNGDPGEQVEELIDAVHKKEWGVAVGLGLMLVVFTIGFFWKSMPSSCLPWLSVFIGVIATAAIDLSAGRSWWRAILSGLTTGSSATGFWELIGKKIAGSRSDRVTKQEEPKE